MAVSFLVQPDPSPRLEARPEARPTTRPATRPRLVALDGGRSDAGRRRRRVFLVRRLVALVALALVVVAAVAVGSRVVGGVAGAAAVPTSYEVERGDTLWSIAGELAPGADRRHVVALLADANGGTTVVPGQDLVVPAGVAG